MTVHQNTRRRRARRSIAASVLLLALSGLLAALVVPATGAEGDELLPDLVAEPVGQADTTATTDTVGGQTRLLLRFTSYVRNIGAGPLEVTGVNPVNRRISGVGLKQVLTHNHDTDGVVGLDKTEVDLPGAELRYEETDLHNHWHFQQAARYSLWNDGKTAEIDASSKVGFCFLDIGHGDPNYNPTLDDPIHFQYSGTVAPKTFGSSTNNCLAHLPSFPDPTDTVVPPRTKVDMGISTGWRDVYERTLPFQYIDVSNLQPGHYWLRSQVDPSNLLRESNEVNASVFASARSTVPGLHRQGDRHGQPVPGQRCEAGDVQDHAGAGPVPQHRRGHPPAGHAAVQDHRAARARDARDRHARRPGMVLRRIGRVQEGRCLQRPGRLQVRGQAGQQPVPAQPGQRSRDASGRQRQRRHGRGHQRHARLGLHRPGRAADRRHHA